MGYTPKYGANRASGIMKTKALSKSSVLFNLGEGSPAKVACGGPLQPPCAKVEQVLDAVKTEGNYTNAQDITKIPTMGREEKAAAIASAKEDVSYALEDQKISGQNLSNMSKEERSKSEKDNPNSKFNYLRSVNIRDRQLKKNANVKLSNAINTLSTQNITNFTDANSKDTRLKSKNKNYLEESYNNYLSKGTDYTSQVDFSAHQNNSKKGQSLSQFTNPTVDKYEKK